jgi:glutamate-1-semialdehyde 2,1-aminomutase
MIGTLAAVIAGRSAYARLLLSRAKHPSLEGHARWAKRIARLVPFYEYPEARFFDTDGATADVAARRRSAFFRLARQLARAAPATVAAGERLEPGVSDVQFTRHYRVPFQYSRFVARHLKIGSLLQGSSGVQVTDLDGQVYYDLTGSYGVNLFGYDFYKDCIEAGVARAHDLGPLLGSYHPVVEENVRSLTAISGLDEVSFHMSGTEAVMQAVRLARFHTGRPRLVRFSGAYHGWWDDVQPGIGSPLTARNTLTLREMDRRTLEVLDRRRDIACVLVNPLQVLHPNISAPGDGALVAGRSPGPVDRDAYASWLKALRAVCTKRSIVLVFDEVFVGFRIAYGGAQEYFGVAADMVTYGKTLGGGLPVGVLCGRARYMKRFRDDRPTDICFARGTFNAHPYVMTAMHEFLRRLEDPATRRSYEGLDETWNARVHTINGRLAREGLPIRVTNLVSIWTVCYTVPSRYNWMFQYYLRAEGLALSWVGTGRLIFSHNYTDADVAAVADRVVAAARAMRDDGWWWHPAGATDRAIRAQVLREIVAARFPWMLRPAGHATALSDTTGSSSSPRST